MPAPKAYWVFVALAKEPFGPHFSKLCFKKLIIVPKSN